MNTIYKANTRGHANHGWLDSHHTFSFANYHNNERMHFGVLRVLNDDIVAPNMGFGQHPHQNMEIISIPLQGSLAHKDTMGNTTEIHTGDIQVMSAGTGIEHSEFNPSDDQEVKFLQIWLFPDTLNVEPRYDQITFDKKNRLNQWETIIAPKDANQGLWIHQNAWFALADLQKGKTLDYELKDSKNAIYLMVLKGSIKVLDKTLELKDAISITQDNKITIEAMQESELLLMEVPLELPSYLAQ
ncbi:pirin family protein [Myroides sp. LJL119]